MTTTGIPEEAIDRGDPGPSILIYNSTVNEPTFLHMRRNSHLFIHHKGELRKADLFYKNLKSEGDYSIAISDGTMSIFSLSWIVAFKSIRDTFNLAKYATTVSWNKTGHSMVEPIVVFFNTPAMTSFMTIERGTAAIIWSVNMNVLL
jgi:hypothetical protein